MTEEAARNTAEEDAGLGDGPASDVTPPHSHGTAEEASHLGGGMAPESTHRMIEPSVLYVGTPVYLVATYNPDGTTNLAPASSHFALGRVIVLGLEELGQSLQNLRRHPELTVNFPAAHQWAHVERLSTVTGRYPVPEEKAGQYTFEPQKFELADLDPLASDLVNVPRVAQAPIQLECRVQRITPAVSGEFSMVEAEVVRVHAASDITVPGTDHLDPHEWHPLIYAYRHFFDRGNEVGWTRKSPLITVPTAVEEWERSGGKWKITDLDTSSATVELLPGEGEPGAGKWAEGKQTGTVLLLTNDRDIRWARWAREVGQTHEMS